MTFAGGSHSLSNAVFLLVPWRVDDTIAVALNRQIPICSEHLQCVRSLSNGYTKSHTVSLGVSIGFKENSKLQRDEVHASAFSPFWNE